LARRLAALAIVAALALVSLIGIARTSNLVPCSTPPISLSDLNDAIAGPVVPFVQNTPLPDSPPASTTDRKAMRAVLNQIVACSNAGRPLSVWSLYSRTYLARLFQIQGTFSNDLYAAYAKPLPDKSDSGMHMQSIEETWEADDMVGTEAIMTYPAVPIPKRLVFWFGRGADGSLKVAEIVGEISFSVP
jgi:hypothetical protein